jgi:2-O-methyltransferase
MDPYIKSFIQANVPSTGVVIEAGTSDGTDTIEFLDIVRDGKVYAFEPIEYLYNQTLERIKSYTNIEYFKAALSTKDGKEIMHVSQNTSLNQPWGSSSFLEPKEHLRLWQDITFDEKLEVDSIRLDKFVVDKNIDVIDFMWLDLQGYEPVLLQYSPITLSKTRYLFTEVSLVETYKDVVLKSDFATFLKNSGFEVIWESVGAYDGDMLLKNINL